MSSAATAFTADAHRRLHAEGRRHHRGAASLVFADISGFTPLSERFATRGRVGAEELTDLLNALFGPTLDVALDLGGDLLKFGGDALLICFSDGDHASTALTAAHQMLVALRGAARREKVAVGMSIGVATGELDLYLAGSLVPELVVCGPVVDKCLALETAASTGQVFASVPEATLTSLEAATRRHGELTEVTAIGNPARPLPPHGSRSPDPSVPLDPAVVAALDAGAPPEHRHAVIGFVHFDLPGDRDPEATGAYLDWIFDVIGDACHATMVCVLSCDVDVHGGKVILTAGVPTTTGDDADRMLQCAAGIVAETGETGLRVGVNAGKLFAGPVGSTRRRAYTIVGDAVNLAARVMGAARPGTLLATREVIERARDSFDTAEVEPFRVKGKRDRVHAIEVIRPTGRRESWAERSRLRGREPELSLLLTAAAAAADRGTGAVIEIVGDAGVGKSHLTRELLDAETLPSLVVECGRYLATNPYGALTSALSGLTGADPAGTERAALEKLTLLVRQATPKLEPWLPFIAIPLGIEMADTEETASIAADFRRRRVHQVFCDFLLATVPRPHTLLIEDAHWMDDAGSELLTTMTPRLTEAGWLVIATRRPERDGWSPGMQSIRLQLGPLTTAATGMLARDLVATTPLPDHVTRVLVERSQGNPLFLRELVRAAADGADPEDLPDRVEVLIEARIDRLTAEQRTALRTVAVLGARVDRSLLDAVAPSAADVLSRLDEFVDVTSDELRFRHALYRDTAYLNLPLKERRTLHAATAEAIERQARDDADEQAELLAVHWFSAADHVRAWPYLRVAGERARADLAPLEASRFLEQALQCIPRLGATAHQLRPEIEQHLAEVYETLGRFADAERTYHRARTHSTDPLHRIELLGHAARAARSMRSLPTAVRRYRRALREVPNDAHATRARLLVGLSSVYEYQGRHRAKLDLLHRAIADAELGGEKVTLAHAHLLLGNTYGDLGDPRGVEHLEIALELFEACDEQWGVASANNNLGVEAYYAGDWETALVRYRKALEGFVRIGDETSHATMLNNIAEIHSDQGRWEDAAAGFEEARRMWRASGFALGVALASSNLGRLATRTGDLTGAAEELAAARSGFEQLHASGFLAELDARLATWHLRNGEPEAALSLADHLIANRADELQPTIRCQLERTAALALFDLARRPEAEERLSLAARIAAEAGAAFEQAAAAAAAAEAGLATPDPTPTWARLGVEPAARRAF